MSAKYTSFQWAEVKSQSCMLSWNGHCFVFLQKTDGNSQALVVPFLAQAGRYSDLDVVVQQTLLLQESMSFRKLPKYLWKRGETSFLVEGSCTACDVHAVLQLRTSPQPLEDVFLPYHQLFQALRLARFCTWSAELSPSFPSMWKLPLHPKWAGGIAISVLVHRCLRHKGNGHTMHVIQVPCAK